jgi:beta-xylosidase
MKGPWVKLWRSFLCDSTVQFLIQRHGHVTVTSLVALLTVTDNGIVTAPEDELATLCQISDEDFQELIAKIIERGIIYRNKDGIICFKNWEKYQVCASAGRTKEYRARRASQSRHGDGHGDTISDANVTVEVEDRSKKIEVRSKETIQRKKERSIKPTEGKYGEFKNVLLDQSYVDKMFRQYGQDQLDAMISMLSTWKEAKHKSLLTDNAGALSGWVKREYKPVPIPQEAPYE